MRKQKTPEQWEWRASVGVIGLTVAVSLAHAGVLWGIEHHIGSTGRLSVWEEAQLTHQLELHPVDAKEENIPSPSGPDVPQPTLGQALNIRTLTLPPLSAPMVLTAAAPKPERIAARQTALPVPMPKPHVPPSPHTAPPTTPPDSSAVLVPEPVAAMPTLADLPPPSIGSVSAPKPAPTPEPDATIHPSAPLAEPTAEIDVAATVAHWPPATRLNYTLHGHYKGDLYGKASVLWQRQGTRYQVQVDVGVSLLFNLRMTSQGRVTPSALWPEVYQEERRGKVRTAQMGDAVVQFDNGNTASRPQHLQDTASQFVQLAQDFAHQRRTLRVGDAIAVPLARPGGIDEWVYDVVALETLNTPLGQVPAFHLQPRPLAKARSGIDVDMWFAPVLQHLPVRIRLNVGPDVWLDLQLDSIDQQAPGHHS